MKDETKRVIDGLVAVGVICWLSYRLIFDNDRPPILVRRGSLLLEHRRKWKRGGAHWKPDHPNGKHVSSYEVVVKAGGSWLPPVQGDRVLVTYSEGKAEDSEKVIFHVETAPETEAPNVAKNVPAVRPADKLELQFDKRYLEHGKTGNGHIHRIEVMLGNECKGDYLHPSEAEIRPKRNW